MARLSRILMQDALSAPAPQQQVSRSPMLAMVLSQMQQQNRQPKIDHWTQGLAHMAERGLSGYMMGRVLRDRKEAQQDQIARGMESQNTMAQALKAASGWTAPDAVEKLDASGKTVGTIPAGTQMQSGDMGGMVQALMGNPDTAPMGMEIQFNQMQDAANRRQSFADKLRERDLDQQTWEARNKVETVQNPYGRGGVGQRNAATGQIVSYQPPQGGPFQGNSMDAQFINTLLTKDPGTPEYRAAYSQMAQPKVTIDPKTGGMTTISPDMSAFRPPFEGQQLPMMADAPETGGLSGEFPQEGPAPQGAPMGGMQTRVPGATITQTPGTRSAPMTDGQANAATYADRMAAAERVLSDPQIVAAGMDTQNKVLGSLPGVGNFMVPDAYQRFEQAQRDFVNAVLRKESGAVISDEEFDNARRQYFPQPGDSPAVLDQKAQNRATALAGIRRAAGPGYGVSTQGLPAETGSDPLGLFTPAPAGSGVDFMWTPGAQGLSREQTQQEMERRRGIGR